MASLADVFVTVNADTSKAGAQITRGLSGVDAGKAGRTAGDQYHRGLSSTVLPGIGKLAAAAGALLVGSKVRDFLTGAVRGASDLNETTNKTSVVFGRSAASVLAWSKTSATSFGLSQQGALAATSQFGDMFHQLGFTQTQSATTSEGLVKLAADLGSFHNVDPTDVLQRVGASLRGEYDSLQQLIPNISAATVQQEALRQTHKKSVADLTQAEKATATLAIIQRDGANAANDFAETSGGLANQQRILAGQTADLKAKVGNLLLPVMVRLASFANTTLVPALSGAIDAFSSGQAPTAGFAGAVGKLAVHARDLGPPLRAAFDQIRSADFSPLTNSAKLAGPALQFLADHVDTLIKYAPLLVAAFVAFKTAEAAANVVSLARIPIMAGQLAVNLSLAASNRALAAAIRGNAVAYNEQAVSAGRAAVASRAAAVGGGAGAVGKGGALGKLGGGALALAGGPAGIALAAGVTLAAGAWAAYTGGANKARDAVKQIVNATDTLGNPVPLARTRTELEKIANAKPPGFWKAGIIGQHAFNEGTKAASAALVELNIKAGLAAQAQRNMSITERQAAAGFPPLTAAAIASGDAVIAAQQANITYKDTIGQTTAAIAQNGRTHDANTVAGRANQTALLSLVSAGKENLNSLVAQRAPAGALTGAVNSQRDAFLKQAGAMGYSKDEAIKLAAKYGLIPKDVSTYIHAKGVAEAEEAARRVKFALSEIKDKTVAINVVTNGVNTAASSINKLNNLDRGVPNDTPRRAHGGYARGLTLVGEKGPELAEFRRPTVITPAHHVERRLAELSKPDPSEKVSSNYSYSPTYYDRKPDPREAERMFRVMELRHG